MRTQYRLSCIAVALVTLSVVCAGCATEKRVRTMQYQTIGKEVPTPAGPVEPPIEPVQVEPYRPYPETAPATAPADDSAMAESAAAFAGKYREAQQPRIAVYVNRTLSGEVREWTTDARARIAYGETVHKESDGKTKSTATSGAITASVDTRVNDDSEGRPLDEKWAWRLEDAIQQPLLHAGARLVERKLIMRLAATAAGTPAYEDVSVRGIEMSALKGHADILAEIQISAGPDPKRGYIYRTRAYEINTGRVLGSTSSATWPRSRRAKGELFVTETGYERTGYANPEKLGTWLAQDLMESLAGSM